MKHRCRKKPLPAGTIAQWYKVESSEAAYNNVPGGAFSFTELSYVSRLWRQGAAMQRADVSSMDRPHPQPGGTMRYSASLDVPGLGRIVGPQLEPRAGGPPPTKDLMKVVLREGDDYLGYLSELRNLPYIFGSAHRYGSHQAELGIGVDCADLAIYGLRRMGHELRYRSSRTLG
ncbi:MAG: hypothetical protein AAF597_21420, partial [Bacteroidota bacterium]